MPITHLDRALVLCKPQKAASLCRCRSGTLNKAAPFAAPAAMAADQSGNWVAFTKRCWLAGGPGGLARRSRALLACLRHRVSAELKGCPILRSREARWETWLN